jgi:hypothetical protein
LHNAHPWHDYDCNDDQVAEDKKTVRELTLVRTRDPTNAVLYQTVMDKLEGMSDKRFKRKVLDKSKKS